MITREELLAARYEPQETVGDFERYFKGDESLAIDVSRYQDKGWQVFLEFANEGNSYHLLPYIPTISQLESLVALIMGKEQVCDWKLVGVSEYAYWDTSCGHSSVKKNEGATYCPYCGKKLVELQLMFNVGD